MPYKSDAQRRFMHARHPEIAARWDAEIHAKKKGKLAKVSKKSDLAKPLAVGIASGTVGGVLANQFPSWEQRQRKKAAKKGQVKKVLAPTSDDPFFNQDAADKAFDLVMKMDDDTAEMFVHVVVSDIFESDVERNLDTLQRHLDEVIAKRLHDTKQAFLRVVSKSDAPNLVAYAQALAVIDKAAKVDWEEMEHPRGMGGRFRTKITHTQQHPMGGGQSKAVLGIETPKEYKGQKLSREDRARFQDEYRQLSEFLGAVGQSVNQPGDAHVTLHFQDAKGRVFSQPNKGTKVPVDDLLDPSTRLVGAEVRPTTLTAGGAAFGLATAMGGGISGEQGRKINVLDRQGPAFATSWVQAGDESGRASNQRLYDRMAASGSLMSSLGPPGSKAQLAGKFAEIVGQHGPQAEAVLGPTARKTAYRYRGTEKTPEKALVRAYGTGIEHGKQYGSMDTEALESRERQRKPRELPGVALHRQGEERAKLAARAPEWGERELGRRAVVDHLRRKLPQKNLYELQLAAGNTPPSEGVVLNAEGQIITQAVGYGDDHYLPFNLKNLKGLKGGEYIRTRSVGGLTSEDVYTALISGARQVTVTSRSGTYTMTFEEDFRGGRRHSDKARRMTRRYEQLLDAVQSAQVDRIDIDPEMRQQIENEVREEMGPHARRGDIQETVKDRIDEFKENPYITEKDELRAEAIIATRSAGATDKERAKIRNDVMDELLEQKETKFRLNSLGYKAAGDALKEQFPYYIADIRWTPPRNMEQTISPEKDKGYVEPGRNRPTAAQAGWYGTAANPSRKYSASQADYQRGRYGQAPGIRAGGASRQEAEQGESAGGTPKDVHAQRRQKAAEQEAEYKVVDVARQIQERAKTYTLKDLDRDDEAALNYTAEELKDSANRAKFARFAEKFLGNKDVNEDRLRREWEHAVGMRDRKPFDSAQVAVWPKTAATFSDDAYLPGARASVVAREQGKIDSKAKAGIIVNKPLSEHTEAELAEEHRILGRMLDMIKDSPGIPLDHSDLEKLNLNPASPGLNRNLRSSPEAITDRMKLLHQARALNLVSEKTPKETTEIRQVAHAPTPPASESPKELATKNATWMRQVASHADDKVERDLITGLADKLENRLGEMTGTSDLSNFMTDPENARAFAALKAVDERRHTQKTKPITTKILE